MLLQPSGDDLAGKYKTEDNFIMETDCRGVRSVRFTPVPASETASAMEQLILAYHDAYSEAEINLKNSGRCDTIILRRIRGIYGL